MRRGPKAELLGLDGIRATANAPAASHARVRPLYRDTREGWGHIGLRWRGMPSVVDGVGAEDHQEGEGAAQHELT